VKSLILQTATRYLMPLLVLFSVFLLLEGHQRPGGGFIGGLIVAASVALWALAYDVPEAARILPLAPHRLIGGGLLVAGASGLGGVLSGRPFLTAFWGAVPLGEGRRLDLGTPLLFDFGVYLVVIGVVLMIVFALAEE
jgi:multicomponent Na+:H+ antiporter subunit B